MIARLIILFLTIYPRIIDQRNRLFAVNRAFIRARRDATRRFDFVVDLEDVERK